MTHERLSEMIRQSVEEVFGTMLGLEVVAGEAFVDHNPPEPKEGVVSLIGLAGQWAGSGSFSCSASLAQKISGALLMQEFSSIDDEVLDAMGEVTNMVLGNVKTALEAELGNMGLSIPTVIYGRNFMTRGVSKSAWSVVPFRCLDETIDVRLCIAPKKDGRPQLVGAKDQLSAVLSMLE